MNFARLRLAARSGACGACACGPFGRASLHRSERSGFTLIEMLAVIAIFALIAAMVVPNLDFGGTRAVRSAASDLATEVELARERAIMTGRVHAVVVDVETNSHWIEWAAPAAASSDAAAPDAEAGDGKLALVPPPIEGEELVPLFGAFGRPHLVEDPVVILGVEIDGGFADTGTIELRMDADGATDPAVVVFGEADGSNAVRVEVEPLADAVAVVNAE